MRIRPALLLPAICAVTMTLASADSLRVTDKGLEIETRVGEVLKGPDLIGKVISLGGVAVRIDSVSRDHDEESWRYALSSMMPAGEWWPLCDPDAKGRRQAFFFEGYTAVDGGFVPKEQRLSIGCTSGALGKCALAGYWPTGGRTRLFLSCVRMIRADYCGDGQSWTLDGTVIDIFDLQGIQKSEQPSLPVEAAWSPEGAVCVHHTRVPSRLTLDQLYAQCPRTARVPASECSESNEQVSRAAFVFNRSPAGE